MAWSDVPPPTAPAWLMPASRLLLGGGLFFWLAAYVLMVRRAFATRDSPMPILALGINIAWEVVFSTYVSELWHDRAGFGTWLVFDAAVVYATLKFGPRSNATSPLVARNMPLLLTLYFCFGIAFNALFAWWWLQEPQRGFGSKDGKAWKGRQGRDSTELAYWSAGVSQLATSLGMLCMLVQRGHSGGQSFGIWACRFIGTNLGLPGVCILLWWYWPEAHGFVFHPLSIILVGTSLACDLAYPFVLGHVKRQEKVLPDGSVVAVLGHEVQLGRKHD